MRNFNEEILEQGLLRGTRYLEFLTFFEKKFVDNVTKTPKKRQKPAFFQGIDDFFSTPPCAAY